MNNFYCDDGEAITGDDDSADLDGDEEKDIVVDNHIKLPVHVYLNERNYISAMFNETCLSMLVDSGADENTISVGMFNYLYGREKLPRVSSSRYKNVVLADGRKRIRVLGKMALKFTINGVQFVADFHIKETEHRSVILGNYFLRNNSAIIDFATNLLSLKPECNVKSMHTVVIPANEKFHVTARVESAVPDGRIGIIESRHLLHEEDDQLVLLESLSTVKEGLVHLCIQNQGCVNSKISKGSVLGKFKVLEDCDIESEFGVNEHRFLDPGYDDELPMRDSPPESGKSRREFLEKFKIDNPHVTESQLGELQDLLYEYRDVFYEFAGKMGHYTHDTVNIDIPCGATPVKKRPYRVHPRYASQLDRKIKLLLDQGVVEPSFGDWASPALVVPKPGRPDEIRLVVDFRAVNKMVQKDAHPLPRIDDTFTQVSSKQPKFFTNLDLQSGYFQIDLDEESRKFTAFCTPQHSLRFTRVPQGLCISGQRFQRIMNKVFDGFINRFMVVYLDDILIYSSSFVEHLSHIRAVLDRLREANLRLKATKCQFATHTVKFLGHLITREGLKADKKICNLVRDCPRPTKVKDIRRFIGLSGFYKKFIRNYSLIARPLHELTKLENAFCWSEKCQAAFEALKEALCSPPVLAHPNFSRPFILYTDSSNFAAGFCLCQKDENGEEHVIAYGGKSYLKYQRNYAITEKEMLASYLGILHFDFYLRHNFFTLVTDHSALVSMLSRQHELKGKFARWAAELMSYRFEVIYKEGRKLINTDALSRMTHGERAENDPCLPELSEIRLSMGQCERAQVEILRLLGEAKSSDPQNRMFLAAEQDKDDLLSSIKGRLNGSIGDAPTEEMLRLGVELHKFHVDESGLLNYSDVQGSSSDRKIRHRVVPSLWVTPLLQSYHDSEQGCHSGADKLMYSLVDRYYWPRMQQQVMDYASSCSRCQEFKIGKAVGKTMVGEIPEPLFNELVVADVCGPLKLTEMGHNYILCIIEYSTRFVRFIPMKDCTAKAVAKSFYDQWVCIFGPPTAMNSDRGPAFISNLLRELAAFLGIRQKFSCPYVARSHGIIERVQLTLQKSLGFYLEHYQDNWDIPLQAVAHAINSTPNKSTGFSPNLLMFGREVGKVVDGVISMPPHSRKTLRDQLHDLMLTTEACRRVAKRCSEVQRESYRTNANKNARLREFVVGQKVYLFVPKTRRGFSKTMSQQWHGPYTVTEKVNEMGYMVKLDETGCRLPYVVHIHRLKAAIIRVNWGEPDGVENLHDELAEGVSEEDIPSDSLANGKAIGQADVHDQSDDAARLYEIERIIQGKHFADGVRYLCKWKGYGAEFNSYEPLCNLNAQARKFLRDNTVKIVGKPAKNM